MLIFTAIVSLCGIVAAATVAATVLGGADHAVAGKAAGGARSALAARPYVVFRSLDRSKGPENFGTVSVATRSGAPRPLGMQCERVYAAATAAICLARARSLTGAYEARILGPDMRTRHTVKLAGVPSRARVSSDGRYGSSTTFVTGHSYAKPGQFSTQTALYDMRQGKRIADLESFAFTDHGKRIDAPDVNFWGVTFARDSNRFYATVATGGETHLVEGSVSARGGKVIHDNVECPSLSPDGTRIGYKKLVPGEVPVWRLHVLDLATMRETALAEDKPIDDQVEWLDDRTLMYHSEEQIWTVPADGTGAPRRHLQHADSPAVVR